MKRSDWNSIPLLCSTFRSDWNSIPLLCSTFTASSINISISQGNKKLRQDLANMCFGQEQVLWRTSTGLGNPHSEKLIPITRQKIRYAVNCLPGCQWKLMRNWNCHALLIFLADVPLSVAFRRTFIAYSVPESFPTIFRTRNTWKKCQRIFSRIWNTRFQSYKN